MLSWFEAAFNALSDPRTGNATLHKRLELLTIALTPERFKYGFSTRVESLRDDAAEIIAIDDKTSRRGNARLKGREALHLVSAWANRQRLELAQEAAADKSNEIVAIPLLWSYEGIW